LGTLRNINQLSYIQRNHVNSRIKTANIKISPDDITYETLPAITWATNSSQNYINLSSTKNIRFIQIDIAESVVDASSVTLAEFRTHYNSTLPVELSSFTAKSNGSSVGLKWTTATESNASHFNFTSSTDGSKFSSIGNSKRNRLWKYLQLHRFFSSKRKQLLSVSECRQ